MKHLSKLNGTPVGSRTPNLLIRSQTLYPIELRALIHVALSSHGQIVKRNAFDDKCKIKVKCKRHFLWHRKELKKAEKSGGRIILLLSDSEEVVNIRYHLPPEPSKKFLRKHSEK